MSERTTSIFPFPHAPSKGVSLLVLRPLTSTPRSRNDFVKSMFPSSTAAHNSTRSECLQEQCDTVCQTDILRFEWTTDRPSVNISYDGSRCTLMLCGCCGRGRAPFGPPAVCCDGRCWSSTRQPSDAIITTHPWVAPLRYRRWAALRNDIFVEPLLWQIMYVRREEIDFAVRCFF